MGNYISFVYLASLVLIRSELIALPTQPKVVHGHVEMVRDTSWLQVNAQGKTILQWDQFDIALQESVQFCQKDTASAILNRVQGGSASQILGRLEANCPIYVVNPNGIFIGTNAVIQTAGFIASTANILDIDTLRFEDLGPGAIIHCGTVLLSEGDVTLVARSINNQGVISGAGQVVLATSELMLEPETKRPVFIRLDAQDGCISKTQSPYEHAIRHTGEIVQARNGRIYLVAKEGTTCVEGSLLAESGEVHILGKEVSLESMAKIDVSGEMGGTILIGGDYKGSNPDVFNAQNTIIVPDAQLFADGYSLDAGKIIVWSDGHTECLGIISAAALGISGDGGFVEISGKKTLTTNSVPNLRSCFGKAGTLLLDPGTITITSGAAVGPNTYGSTYINTTLASGNLILDTSTEPGGGPETLTVASAVTGVNAISWATANTLTLNAGQGVIIQSGAAINATGGGNLLIQGQGTVAGVTYQGISITAATLTTTTGSLQLSGIGGNTGTTNQGISISGSSTISTTSGALTLTGTGGNASSGISMTGGIVETTAGGLLSVTGTGGGGTGNIGVAISGTTTRLRTTNNGSIQLTGTGGGTGTSASGVSVLSAAQISTSGSGTLNLTGTASTLASSSQGLIVSGSGSLISGDAGLITLITVGGGTGNSNIGISLTSSGSISSTSGGMQINSKGTVSGGSNNIGIFISSNGSMVALNSATMDITSTGSAAIGSVGNGNDGIFLSSPAGGKITTTSGTLNIMTVGAEDTTGNTNRGIHMEGGGGGIIGSAGTANVIIQATGSSVGGSSNAGVWMFNITDSSQLLITTAGNLSITGVGASATAGSNNLGIFVSDTGGVRCLGASKTMTLTAQGNGLGGNARGLWVEHFTQGVQSTGSITIDAIGSISTSGNGNYGILLTAGNLTATTLNISSVGASNSTGSDNIGINIGGFPGGTPAGISASVGNIIINAVGAPFGSSGNKGVFLNNTINANAASIDSPQFIQINATGAGLVGTTGNIGLDCETHGKIRATGNVITSFIDVTAQSGGSGGSNVGLLLASDGLISSITGNVTLRGTGGSAAGTGNTGISVSSGTARITSTDGVIGLTGNGGNSSIGISLTGGTIDTTGTGNMSCIGNAGSGTGAQGILITGSSSLIQTVSGAMTLTGTGNGTGTNADGISVLSAGRIRSTGTGSITLQGTASSAVGANNNSGILVSGTSSLVTTLSGNINLTATGGGSGANNRGLSVLSGGVISTTTTGVIQTIAPHATGGNGTTGCHGIFVDGTNSRITALNGGINLIGTANGTGTTNQGIRISTAGGITSTGTASITLNGTGSVTGTSSCEGIFVTGTSTVISAVNALIQLTGTPGGGTTNGITIDTSANVSTSTSGNIIANSSGRLLVNNNSNLRTLGVSGPNLNNITITTAGVSILAGAASNASASISTVNGNIDILSSSSMLVTASTALNTFAQCTVGNAVNTLNLRSVGLTLTGSSGLGSFAEVSTNGGILSIDGTTVSSGAISLTGGSNTNTYARIITKTTARTTADNLLLIGQGAGNVHPTTITLQGGTAGTPAYAIIATDTGGNILSTITGLYTITGGSGTGSSSAGIYSGLTSGSGNITATATRFLLTGGSNTGTNRAEISAAAAGGSINLTATSGLSTLQGGSGATTQARIITNGAGNITLTSNGNVSLLGSTAAGGTNASATISTANGNITGNITGLLTLTGGSQTGTIAQVTVGNSANTVSLVATGGSLSGGTGSGAFAEISTIGGLLSYDGAGALTLTGGSNTNTDARIITTTNAIVGNAIQIGQITPVTSITLQGGTSGRAIIASDVGGNILCTTSGNYTITGGTGAIDSRAGIYAGLTSGSGNIDMNGNTLSLTGGASGAGINRAEISTPTGGGVISITLNNTPLTIQGGGATTSDARIITQAVASPITINGVTSFFLTGGSGANSVAQVVTNAGGDLIFTIPGDYVITGGTGATDSSAGIYSGLTAGTGDITLIGNNYTLTGGPSGTGANRAEISAALAGGSISLTSNTGDILLQGGGSTNATARIIANGAGNITLTSNGNVSLLGSTTAGGTNASATISTANGNITGNITGLLTLTGGSQTGTIAQVTVGNSANTVSLVATGGSLSGGTGSGAFAEISTIGGLLSYDGAGALTLTGGSNTNTDARIITTTNAIVGNAIQIGQMTPPTSITLQGSSGGTSSRAIIASNVGGNILCTTSGVLTATGGSSTGNSSAGIYSGLTSGSGNITATATRFLLTGGSNTGTNRAEISAAAAGGSINLTGTSGLSTLQGGSGDSSEARIITEGTGSIQIITAGDLNVLGGTGLSSDADINAQGTLTVDIGSNTYQLTGGNNTSSLARMTSIGGGSLIGGNYILTAGSSPSTDGSNALIQTIGPSASLSIVASQDIALNAGAAADQHTYIRTTSAVGSNPVDVTCRNLFLNGSVIVGATNSTSKVQTTAGNVQIVASSDVQLQAGSEMGSMAKIEGVLQGNMDVSCANLIVQNAIAIGDTGIETASGNIAVHCLQDCIYTSSLIDPMIRSTMRTLGSDLTVIAQNIRLFGHSLFSTPNLGGHLLLQAGIDIELGSLSRVHVIGNANSSLTMIVDSNFSTAPLIGPGKLIMHSGALVFTGGLQASVKLYTATFPQNIINVSQIAGSPWTPGPEFINSVFQEWGVYAPGGTYGGYAFKFYYKNTNTPPNPPSPFAPSQANERARYASLAAIQTQLQDLLPILKAPCRFYNFPGYHFSICQVEDKDTECDAIFDPYGSFIFEDDIYWIPENIRKGIQKF